MDDFDLEAVLAPVPGDNPVGMDPREDVSPTSIYYRLRDARAEAREMERQAESSGDGEAGPPPPWRVVRSLAEQGLATTAKDLELATWLMEALVRAAGLRGLATGAMVVTGLVQGFWDGLYPTPDEDGIETRVGPLAGLSGQGVDGSLMQPLRKTMLFRRGDGSGFAYWQYELSVELAGISDSEKREQKIIAGVVPFDDVEKEARFAGPAHWAALRAEVAGALEAWRAMSDALDAHAGDVSPSTSRVRNLLVDMEATAARFSPDVEEAPAEMQEPGMAGGSVSGGGAGPAAAGGIAGREQALRQLSEIAAWFKRHEPNSPLAYTLDEAVRRGRMSWPELIAELMPDESARHQLIQSLGIKPVVPEE